MMIIAIIGGGVVGLNCALELSHKRPNDEIFVLEAEPYLGTHTSTRNSEVIHAGFAYLPKSLKTELCIEGARLSYELLGHLNVPCKRCGKWIVAFTPKEEEGLQLMLQNASECAVPGVIPKSPSDVADAMPWLKPVCAAAFSETSGVMDTSEYIAALDRALSHMSSCHVLTSCAVKAIHDGRIETSRGEMKFDLLINSAGLFADDIYRMASGKRKFEIKPFKGEYYIWRKGPFEGLIYPVPDRFVSNSPLPLRERVGERGAGDATLVSSMGIHLHRSIGGDRCIGPSQMERPKDKKTDYRIETPPEIFAQGAGRYLNVSPDPSELEPAQAGNRPKLFEDGKPVGDFVIFKEGSIIHLLGIESPGLTAAPAIARKVAAML
jgi:L-2-hydroxyglutarate oxidase LhgO